MRKLLVLLLFLLPIPAFGEPLKAEGGQEKVIEAKVSPETSLDVEEGDTSAGQIASPFTAWDAVKAAAFIVHLNTVVDLPMDYGWYVYRAAVLQGVDRYHLAAILISEKSGPDVDFSIEAATSRTYSYKWNPKAEGADGERGIFQVMPRWAKKAGYSKDDMWDPKINAMIGAYVVYQNYKSHAKCEKKRFVYHTWAAHYKCARKSRDSLDPQNQCRWAQMSVEKIYASLFSLYSLNYRAIGRAHLARFKKVQKAAEKWVRKQQAKRSSNDNPDFDGADSFSASRSFDEK